jgi:SAM-dependent methyltransferase
MIGVRDRRFLSFRREERALNNSLPGAWRMQRLIDALQCLVGRLEDESELREPNRLRERLETLDLLDAHFPENPRPVRGDESHAAKLARRARAIHAQLEAVNCELYEAIRREIRLRMSPKTLLQWFPASAALEEADRPENMGYDYLDELISGVFQFEEPNEGTVRRESEKVFYQPTPARHISSLISQTALSAADVLIDLGSGLGHVPLIVSILTPARGIGIELEATYVERAQQCAQKLNLPKVRFIHQDAREANLSSGTVFYLYTPFTGSILDQVLYLLRREAKTRPIRICTYGPCTSVVAEESWLEKTEELEMNRIALFRSGA